MSYKILIAVTSPVTFGFYRGQIEYLKNLGFHITLISSPGEELLNYGLRYGVDIQEVPMKRSIDPTHDFRALVHMIAVIRKCKPDIVHGSTPKAGLLSMLAATILQVPIRFYTIRGLITETQTGSVKQLIQVIQRITCACSTRVLVNSNSVLETLVGSNICTSDKMALLNKGSSNGVDAAQRFNPDLCNRRVKPLIIERSLNHGQSVIIGFVGRLANDKGIRELVGAWQIVKQIYDSAMLVLVGDLDERDPAPANLIATLRNDPKVHMFGWIQNDQMPEYYASMDILVLPTYREGFPNVVLEASAMALPIVATKVTGCVDAVIDGVTGTLVPARDYLSLAQAILKYINDPRLRKEHGEAGREMTLRDFKPEDSWEAIHQEYLFQLRKKGLIR